MKRRVIINEEHLNQIITENISKYILKEGLIDTLDKTVGRLGRWQQRKKAAMNGQVLINNPKSFAEYAQYQITLGNNVAQLINNGQAPNPQTVKDACDYLIAVVNGQGNNNGNEYNKQFKALQDFYEEARNLYQQQLINTQNYQPLGQALKQYYNNYQGLVRGFETLTNAETDFSGFEKQFLANVSQAVGGNQQLEGQVLIKYGQDLQAKVPRKDAQKNALAFAQQLAQQQKSNTQQQKQ